MQEILNAIALCKLALIATRKIEESIQISSIKENGGFGGVLYWKKF
jgi:hypothetical protein